jgi:hypothetical protein
MLDDIQTLVAEPISRFVRQMPMYSQNADLFVALEAERSRGNFRYIKRVLSSRNELDSASNFWCWRSAADFEDMQFYFSNSTSADVENDQPIDPALARQLRLFLNAVLSDPIFREAVESTPEAISMLDLVQGRSKGCSEYYGSITDGRPDIRRLSISIEGVEVIGLRSEVRPFRIGQVPSLRAD